MYISRTYTPPPNTPGYINPTVLGHWHPDAARNPFLNGGANSDLPFGNNAVAYAPLWIIGGMLIVGVLIAIVIESKR